MTNKTVVVTGANRGIGFAAARELASKGAAIIMVCRDGSRGEHARAKLAEIATGSPPELLLVDLSSQAEIHRLAAELKSGHDHIEVLLNSAGGVFDRRELTAR